jgi:hypothetical protein
MYIMVKMMAHLHVLLPKEEKEALIAAAHRAGKNLSVWVRESLLKLASKGKRS